MKEGYAKAKTGEEVLIGKYTLEIREAYMYYRIECYMIDHPTATRKKAGQMARHAWRQKAARSMKPQIMGMPIKTDSKLAPNEIRFDHPDGRSQGMRITEISAPKPQELPPRVIFVDRERGIQI